ncbi:hypothetical protein BY458DRAFT_260584 [Sporodiniella umbellata]|nr:hypothetical protein BY458DRAFT_260584 [Sporodiniella umbellata]
MQVVIRFIQRDDLIFHTESSQTIRSLRHQISQQLNEPSIIIRLMYRGQLLTHDTFTLKEYRIYSERVYIHCQLTGRYEIIQPATQTKIKSDRGFDKFKDSGYNEEEIRSIRTRFHLSHSRTDYIDGGTYISLMDMPI